jgi:hypothetical protein
LPHKGGEENEQSGVGGDGVHLRRVGIALGAHLKASASAVLVGALRVGARFALDCVATMATVERGAQNDATGR